MNKKYNELHIQQAMILSQALAAKPQTQISSNPLLQTLMGGQQPIYPGVAQNVQNSVFGQNPLAHQLSQI